MMIRVYYSIINVFKQYRPIYALLYIYKGHGRRLIYIHIHEKKLFCFTFFSPTTNKSLGGTLRAPGAQSLCTIAAGPLLLDTCPRAGSRSPHSRRTPRPKCWSLLERFHSATWHRGPGARRGARRVRPLRGWTRSARKRGGGYVPWASGWMNRRTMRWCFCAAGPRPRGPGCSLAVAVRCGLGDCAHRRAGACTGAQRPGSGGRLVRS